MQRYIVQRLLQGVIVLILVATIVFFLGRLTGNPVDLMLPEDATAEDRQPAHHRQLPFVTARQWPALRVLGS